MQTKTYSESFKRNIVRRMLMPNGPSASTLSREVGISQPTLSKWKRSYGTVASMSNKTTPAASSFNRASYEMKIAQIFRTLVHDTTEHDRTCEKKRFAPSTTTLNLGPDACLRCATETQSRLTLHATTSA